MFLWKRELIDRVVWVASLFHKRGPGPDRRTPREILVLRPCDLGDLLTATPIFETLRRRFPEARLIAGVGSWARPILENNPFIDEIVELDVPWNNKFIADQSMKAVLRFLFTSPQMKALRGRGGFDVGVDLLGSHFGSAMMMLLGVRYMVGIRDYRAGWRACDAYTPYSEQQSVVNAALAQAALLGATDAAEARPQLYLTAEERAEATRLWSAFEQPHALRVLVGAGGGFEEKCWPADQVAQALTQLTAALQASGRTLNILLLGGKADRQRADEVMRLGPQGIRALCGETSLRTSFALAGQAELVLTNSSMLLHAAAAFHRPTVCVLGPLHFGVADHDGLWGYPPPYASAGPSPAGGWPPVEEVVGRLLSAVPIASG